VIRLSHSLGRLRRSAWLPSLCFAWYCALENGDIGWSLRPHAHQAPSFARVLQEQDPQEGRQNVVGAAPRRVRVQFAPGRSAVALAGQVHGYDTIDYVLDASTQQRLTVRLRSASPYLLMGIYAPDGDVLCVEACERQWTGLLARAGDYSIRIGLTRAEARRQGRASYTLHVGLTR
jgi:hypothetical protein